MKGMLKKFIALAAVALFWSSQANAVLIEIIPDTCCCPNVIQIVCSNQVGLNS